jgi:hypothetical protein
MALVVYVLADSNKTEWSQWTFIGLKWQPQLWVAICSTLAGTLLNFAFVEGLVIYFWNHARAGTTVRFGDQTLSFIHLCCMPCRFDEALGIIHLGDEFHD